MRENEYQSGLIKRIQALMPDCLVLKNDPNYLQGILDLTVVRGRCFAMLEVKASEKSKERPNQRYYVDEVNRNGGFAAFIYPENEEEVLRALQSALGC
jgi:hypothetical protein